jgi:hypothetical protein
MKHVILILGFLSISGAAFADVDKEELKKLLQAGFSDELILSYARAKGSVSKLSADDVVELKKAGFSDGLLTNLLRLAEPAPNPMPATSAAVQRLLSDPDIVYDGRYFYPRSYFSSGYSNYSSAGIGIGTTTVYPAWCVPRYEGVVRWNPYYGGQSCSTLRLGYGSYAGARACWR